MLGHQTEHWTWIVLREKVMEDLLTLLSFHGFYTEGDLQKITPGAVQYLFATVCQISGTCANFSNQAKENSKAKIALYQNVKSQQLKVKV